MDCFFSLNQWINIIKVREYGLFIFRGCQMHVLSGGLTKDLIENALFGAKS